MHSTFNGLGGGGPVPLYNISLGHGISLTVNPFLIIYLSKTSVKWVFIIQVCLLFVLNIGSLYLVNHPFPFHYWQNIDQHTFKHLNYNN